MEAEYREAVRAEGFAYGEAKTKYEILVETILSTFAFSKYSKRVVIDREETIFDIIKVLEPMRARNAISNAEANYKAECEEE